MHHQVGDLILNGDGIAERGLPVRHLVLPDGLAGTAQVCKFLAAEVSPRTYVNIMDQYHPAGRIASGDPLARRIAREEYELALAQAEAAGLRPCSRPAVS